MMNIMYIFNGTTFGGAGQSLLDILVEIKSKINPIVIIRDDAAVEDTFGELGVICYKVHFLEDYVKIGCVSKDKKEADFRQSYEAAMQLIPIIKKENIQLIHINSSVSYFGAIAALMTDVPYIWHIRELMEEQFGCQFLNEEIKKLLYEKADRLIAISDYVQHQYKKKYHVDMVRIYNGLNVPRFKMQLKAGREYKNVFLVAGMITPEKGQWDVLRAAEIVIKKGYSNIKVIIVGSGAVGYVWTLKKYITKKNLQKNICIMPFQNDLFDLRRQSSYAITSSQNEALGRVTIEAMLAGNVVIGTRSGGTVELIGEHEERGFLYELGNIQQLADVMIRVMEYPTEAKDMIAKKAQIYAEKNFDSKQYCKDLINLYRETIISFVPQKKERILSSLKEYYELVGQPKKNNTKQENIGFSYKKLDAMFRLTLKWLELKQKGISFDKYFAQNHIKSIAIYGMGHLGRRLYDELENSETEIKYIIDRNPTEMSEIFEFSSLDGKQLDVDVVVVTVILAEQQIIKDIQMKGYEKVIGLSEIINTLDAAQEELR